MIRKALAAMVLVALTSALCAAGEVPVAHHATLATPGGKLNYVVSAGMLGIKDSAQEATADMFYVAYVADTKGGRSERPVTFAFNGGPGTSDYILHLLALGPLRADVSLPLPADHDDNRVLALGENAESVLDHSDLVLIDAVSTGYSHAVGRAKESDFWGMDEDAESFATAIQTWLNLNHRWNSPVAVLGESYGGTRAAILGGLLPQRGVRLGAVVLISPGLTEASTDWYSDSYFADFLPSYAAAAWYHKRLAQQPPRLEEFLQEARKFAMGSYLSALSRGSDLPPDERRAIARRMSELTGLEESYLLRNNLRVNPLQFGKELLRDKRILIGPLDARQQGIDVDPNGPPADVDPISLYLSSHVGPLIRDYLTRDLGYRSDTIYRVSNLSVQERWNWLRKVKDEYPWTSRPAGYDLANAVNQHPNIKVLLLSGYYDLVTPFMRTEVAVSHMPIYPSLRNNFTLQYYETGHMVYLDDKSRKKMKADLDAFYDSAFGGAHRQ
jgi:carboxypeptidase C (cathepsin A)